MVGHDGTLVMSNVLLRENFGWALELGDRDVRLGWDTPNENATLEDNTLVGLTIFKNEWTGISMSGNTFIGEVQGVAASDYPDNQFLDVPPAENLVVVRPNRFEPGRAHIIVYNWEGLDRVTVELAPLLPVGADFEIRNAQDVFSAPVVAGTFDGSALELPMTGLEPALPIGDPEAIPAEQRTGRDFNVFLLRAAVCE